MKFSYFSNADNTYNNNTRNTNVLILEIVDQAIFAEKIGMHSVWVGEHHFNEFGTNPSPHVTLTHILAKTDRVRVMPGVVVLPLQVDIFQVSQDTSDKFTVTYRGKEAWVPRHVGLGDLLQALGALFFREQYPLVKRVDVQVFFPLVPQEKVPRHTHAQQGDIQPFAHFNADQGQGDWNAQAPLQHLVQEAVAWIVVVVEVALKPQLIEQIFAQGVDAKQWVS